MANDYDIGKAFKAIEDELIASMIRNLDRHKAEETKEGYKWSMWQAEQLKALEKYKRDNHEKYGKQFQDINSQIGELIRTARSEGGMSQEAAILKAIKQGFPAKKISAGATAEFFRLNDRKLGALIKATTNDMQKAETAVLRMVNDQYRKVIFNSQVYANSGAGTYEKAVDMATKDFLSAGLNCVEYKNGARHTLADYADMAIQTASKRAYLQGEGEKRHEWGIHTVIMNKRGNPCPKCLPFVGKVMIDDVWSGGSKKDGSYQLMSTAIAAGLYHPRCRDSHTTYFPGISTPPDDKYTRQELVDVEKQAKQDSQEQYAERQADKFGRLAKYSLDQDNQRSYSYKENKFNDQKIMLQAKKFTDREDADKHYRHGTEELWDKLTEGEKKALYEYTGSSYIKINKALRSGNETSEGIQKYIENMTNAIDKSRLDEPVWVRRGVSANGVKGLFKVNELDKDTIKSFVGKSVTEKGFMSTGVSKESGFSGINLEICLPQNTKAVYAEPFSAYGGTNSDGNWNGKETAKYIGEEAELIVQRGSVFEVKDIKVDDNGKISSIVLLLIQQI